MPIGPAAVRRLPREGNSMDNRNYEDNQDNLNIDGNEDIARAVNAAASGKAERLPDRGGRRGGAFRRRIGARRRDRRRWTISPPPYGGDGARTRGKTAAGENRQTGGTGAACSGGRVSRRRRRPEFSEQRRMPVGEAAATMEESGIDMSDTIPMSVGRRTRRAAGADELQTMVFRRNRRSRRRRRRNDLADTIRVDSKGTEAVEKK